MSEKVHHARCCGCNCRIDVNGQVLRGGDGEFLNMTQVREAAKNHQWFCTGYTGDFYITAEWRIEVKA